ncbi:MAG: isocitrate lyase/phosphoenolpyruvate mutase family protein [Proteobacteria bacterium]|nr:isocitrate lyase/phosphoenolpyruvate mutase family protein [Pseudomonadota bacterium]
MNHAIQIARAQAFRRLHDRTAILLLPNAWDAGSAALFARRGFPAIATTSGGMAWSLGYADGECVPLPEVLAAVARITRAVDVPVSVDFEGGYGHDAEAVGASVRAVIAAGAVGINLEDGMPGHGPLRPPAEAAARIAAARAAADAAGVPIFINARVDHWLHPAADPAEHLADAIARARAYLAAGADGIYPLGLTDRATLAAFIRAVDAPVNVAAGAGVPPLAELAALGVARVSTATRLATLALGAVDHAVRRVLDEGGFDALAADFVYADAQGLFGSRN